MTGPLTAQDLADIRAIAEAPGLGLNPHSTLKLLRAYEALVVADRVGQCVPADATLTERIEAAAALLCLSSPAQLLEALRDAGLLVLVDRRDKVPP